MSKNVIDMSSEELIQYFDNAIAKAIASVASANAGAVTAQAGAGQAGAGVGASNARTQSNSETDTDKTVSTGQTFENVDSDINVIEAWQANVKRTYDVHQTYDMETMGRNRLHFDELIAQKHKHLANLDHMTLQALANNQNQSNLNNTLGIDRAWNVNETDAFAVLLNKVVSEAVSKAMEK